MEYGMVSNLFPYSERHVQEVLVVVAVAVTCNGAPRTDVFAKTKEGR
jgi:hypothetical protein